MRVALRLYEGHSIRNTRRVAIGLMLGLTLKGLRVLYGLLRRLAQGFL